MYDPRTGRWTTQDPLSFAAGDANLYRYVGNGATNYTDPSGLAELSNDDKFRKAARRNGVPDEIIELMIETAKEVQIPEPNAMGGGFGRTHDYCKEWVEEFQRKLDRKLNAKGLKDGLSDASKKGIKLGSGMVILNVPGSARGNPDMLGRDQDHNAYKIVFKDGTTFYIDCSTLSSSDVNNLTGGSSHFTPAEGVPKGWQPYPLPPMPPQKTLLEEQVELERRYPEMRRIGPDGATGSGRVIHPRP